MNDDELAERLRRTFEHVADASPVPPPPTLPVAPPTPLRRRPRIAPFVLAAAAALVIAAVVALFVDAPEEDVVIDQPPTIEEEPSPSTPVTADADGTAEARATDGALVVSAVVASGGAEGLIAVQVEATDGEGRAVAVRAQGPTLPGAAATLPGCDGTVGRLAEVGFTMGVDADRPVDVVVTAVADPCDGDGDGDGGERSEVDLRFQLPALGTPTGDDGPRSPVVDLDVAQASSTVDVRLLADAVDAGCLAEVLVDWGDRSTPARPVAACDPTAPSTHDAALSHEYEPGTYTLRVTVSSRGTDGVFQVGFVEREIVVENRG